MLAALLLAAVAATTAYRAPRLPDGHADLQGEWTNATWTSLQRPREFKKAYATDAEATAYIAKLRQRQAGTLKPEPGEEPSPDEVIGSAQSEWYEGVETLMRLDGRLRTSLIVEPADGRLPYNAFGRRIVADALTRDETAMDGPEDRMSDERCLMGTSGVSGPPMLPFAQNAHYQIVQAPGVVAIHSEMIHDVRLVRMDGRHDTPGQTWGDSVGRWDGDALVVETTGQHALTAQRFVGSGILVLTPGAKVVERFTRISPTEIRYAFQVEDAAVYTRPWRAEALFRATDERMFEYACHEGNYALRNILSGARKKEADAKAVADKAKPAIPPVKAKAD